MTPERKNKLHGRPPLRRTSIETQYGFPPGFEAYLKRTFPKIQFIVTTHSPFIVQSLRTEELINLDAQVNEPPFTKSIEEIATTILQEIRPERLSY